MNTFLLNKTQYYIDRSYEYALLFKYIMGNHTDFTVVNDQSETDSMKANQVPLLALLSQPGDGKTMLLAKFVLDIEVIFLQKKKLLGNVYFQMKYRLGKNER